MEKLKLNTRLLSALHSVLFMQAADIRKAVGIARSTWYDLMAKPEGITVQYLLAIANGLHIPVRRFFSTGNADIIGKRDDYIAEPYTDCYYAGDALRDIIRERQDATWKLAGEIAGMSYRHIQKSLSSETRTPVVRFLAVCEAFGIDPFTILVDPNPEPESEKKKSRSTAGADVLKEISTLREDIGRLSETVADISGKYKVLLEKYDALMKAHRELLGRFNEHARESCVGLAAEPVTEPEPDK